MVAFISKLEYQTHLAAASLVFVLAPVISFCVLFDCSNNTKDLQSSNVSVETGHSLLRQPFSKEQKALMQLDLMDPEFAGLADTVSLQTYRRDPELAIFWKRQAVSSREARGENKLVIAHAVGELACMTKSHALSLASENMRQRTIYIAECDRQKALRIARECACSKQYTDEQSRHLMRQIWNMLNSYLEQVETDDMAVCRLSAVRIWHRCRKSASASSLQD